MGEIIVAIDGYSGTGKSSTAKQVAEKLGYTYIDSGAMYRAITLFLLRNNIDIQNLNDVERTLEECELKFDKEGIWLNDELVEDQIRAMDVNKSVSHVSAISAVRTKLVAEQRKMSSNKGVVMDGRDIGTVVFPNAELKIFMTAEMEVRVDRRKKQLASKGIIESEEKIAENLEERDQIDTSRKDSPLAKATDAIEIDTSHITLDQQIDKIVQLANELK